MSIRLPPLRIAGVVVGLALIAGCPSKEKYKLIPAEGILKIDGKPAGNVTIQFMPDVSRGGTGPTSYATTDAEGRFQLKTYDGRDGAVEGPHLVTLADNEEDRPPQGKPPRKAARLDSRYTTTAGGLTADVKPGTPLELNVPGFGS